MSSTILPSGAPKVRTFGEPHLRTDGDLQLLTFAANGNLLSVEEPGVLRIWTPTGQPLGTHNISDLETLWSFSHDGRFLISGSDDLTVWDTSSGHVLTALPQDSWVTALALNTDPAFLATGHDDGTVCYWDFAGHLVVHTFKHHLKPISALAIHSDGKTLAVACEDKTISLWDLSKGEMIGVLSGHTDRIPALAWHPTQQVLVSGGWDTTARVWDTVALKPLILLNSHSAQVTALAFNASGSLLACADSGMRIHVWDFATKKTLHHLAGPTVEIRSIAFAPDGTTLAATGDRVIHLWDATTGQPRAGTGLRSQARPCATVHPEGTFLASNGGGRDARVWNLATGQLAFNLPDTEEIHQLAYSSDGQWLAAAAGKHLRIWHAETGKLHLDCDGPDEPINLVAFSPNSDIVAGASNTGTSVWLWNVSDGEPVLLIPDALQGCAVMTLAFHPGGKILAVGGIDWLATGGSTGALSLWDIVERAEVGTLPDGTTAIAFHPTGESIAASTLDHAICLYGTDELNLQEEILGHDDNIICLAFSPSGELLASASEDRTLRLWDIDGYELARVDVDSTVTSLWFSADGQYLYTAHANTTCGQYAIADLTDL